MDFDSLDGHTLLSMGKLIFPLMIEDLPKRTLFSTSVEASSVEARILELVNTKSSAARQVFLVSKIDEHIRYSGTGLEIKTFPFKNYYAEWLDSKREWGQRVEFLEFARALEKINPQKFQNLFTKLNILKKGKQRAEQQAKTRQQSKTKRAQAFTLPQQKYIARIIFNDMVKQSLLLQLTEGSVSADALDRTGDTLFKCLDLFNIDKTELINNLLSHQGFMYDKENAAATRRFALAFSATNRSVVGMIDDDPLVRELAEQKHSRR